jgi:hypothetical protein
MFADAQTMTLSMILHDTLNGPGATDELSRAVKRAAVHAWMEGHVEGERRAARGSISTRRQPNQPMPSPPFPSRRDPRLSTILRETNDRFAGAEPVAAVLFASGLAYQAGLEEGARCAGCTCGGSLRDGARIRAGQLPLTLHAGVPALVDTHHGEARTSPLSV